MAYIEDIRAAVGHQPLILTSASGALLDKQGAVLLQERADTGNWGFPGGYMAYGESFAQTVKREFKEDAGILVEPVKLLRLQDNDQYTYPNGDQVQPINAFYLVRAVNHHQFATKPTETVQTRYFALNDEPPRFFNQQHAKMWQILKKAVKLNQLK
ncbi:NUDIX hydrolase [Limosilactobacillus sp.]|uniref:NUDIX hydrolase n=1 Tax=Limosilactobacillus sp. TaxID=2773925 RepID=UPI003F0347EA